jgi:tetraacyldisaccharide 4'-kinase
MEPEKIVNRRVLPAGPFREFHSTAKKADLILKEGREYRRSVTCDGSSDTMMLAASIARPERLEPYLPDGVSGRYIVPDHAWFDENSLKRAMEGCGADTLLVTEKDLVKMKGFKLPIAVLRLQLQIDPAVLSVVDRYVKEYHAPQN